jgi:hypothetical protein
LTNRRNPDLENEVLIQKIIGNDIFELEDFGGKGILRV